MINSSYEMVIFNKYLDSTTRRDLYKPSLISGVSVYDKLSTGDDGGYKSESLTYKVRIPVMGADMHGKSYMPENDYDKLTDAEKGNYWTIHSEDLLFIVASNVALSADILTTDTDIAGAKHAADIYGAQGRLVVITEYADNTGRGSMAVKHWRIGGA